MRWFTSDLHFGHENVIRYCDRPFSNVGVMDNAIVAMWNSAIAPDDEVWVLGDLAMGSVEDSLAESGKLVGRKYLVLGNHDKPFDGGKKAKKWTPVYLEVGGFEDLHDGVVELELSDGSVVLLCHFPYEGDSCDRDRHVARRPPDTGKWLLHGHVHSKWRQRGRMINVGIDAWAGVPVSEAQIIELIAQGPRDLVPLDWSWPSR